MLFLLIILTFATLRSSCLRNNLQKGVVPAAPSGTATLLRLSPNYQVRPRPILAVVGFQTPIRTEKGFRDPRPVARWLPSVPPIVTRV